MTDLNIKSAAAICQVVPHYDVWYSESGAHRLFLSVVRAPDGSIQMVSTLASDMSQAVIEAEKHGKVLMVRRFLDLFTELVVAP